MFKNSFLRTIDMDNIIDSIIDDVRQRVCLFAIQNNPYTDPSKNQKSLTYSTLIDENNSQESPLTYKHDNEKIVGSKSLSKNLPSGAFSKATNYETLFGRIYFEISGICNAKCYWCKTGYENLQKANKGRFVDFEKFKETINYLLKNSFILHKDTEIALYNWGEPFLHPKFKDIIRFLHDKQLPVILSTNASRPVFFEEPDVLSNVRMIMFSMCGFSQESYDKIHGFEFQKIKNNIIDIITNFRKAGFNGRAILAFHVYQFNMNEVLPASQFSIENEIQFMPSFAFINDFDRGIKYLKNELDYEGLKRASQDLILFNFNTEKIKQRPQNFECGQYSKLVLDENCNVITCCGDSTVMDSIFNVKNQDVNKWRKNYNNACKICRKIGADFIGATIPPLKSIIT